MGDKLKDLYIKFRSGPAFLISLCVLLVTWIILHVFFGFDSDKSTGNFLLSIEASFSGALLIDLMFRMSTADRATFQKMLELEEQNNEVLRKIYDLEEQVSTNQKLLK